jgi:serine/threonine protein kinase
MLKGIAAQLLGAIDFLHSADVTHGSLSSGSVLLSHDTDCKPDELVLKGKSAVTWARLHNASRSVNMVNFSGRMPIMLCFQT